MDAVSEEAAAAAAEDAAKAHPGALPLLPGSQLNLGLYPGGCHRLLDLCVQHPLPLLQVEFLRLSTHEDPGLLEATLARVPWSLLLHLRSLVLKGGQNRGPLGACLRGALTTLPAGLCGLACLAHLDLSFNRLEALPSCVLQLHSLDTLLLSHNRLSELPEALGALPTLTFLAVTHNRLQRLPGALGSISTLQRLDLSKNLLDAVPPEIGGLSSLCELNLASNQLRSLPASLAGLRCLRLLVLHSNLLTSVPVGLARLPLLTRLDLRDNQLRDLPPELLDAPFVRLQGNPLGGTSPDSRTPPAASQDPEMPRLFLTSDLDSFPVTPHGCSVTLACGVRLQFPAGAIASPITIHYRLWLPEPDLVSLGPHDFLLSGVLELQPHGLAFQQDVGLWLLFIPPGPRRCREVVVRMRSEDTWSDLETHVEEEAPRVVRMASQELQALVGEPEAAVSPLLCLSQSGPPTFLQPVTVQLPLPPGITGFSVDRSRLHLLYRAPPTATWDDITAQVALELTHLYARFQVLAVVHHQDVCGGPGQKGLGAAAAAQSKPHRPAAAPGPPASPVAVSAPEQGGQRVGGGVTHRPGWTRALGASSVVLLQVDATLGRLLGRYRGPEPSDTVEMFEGEKFFAAFERGIHVDADRPDCVDGRICFVFYSHLKNMKEVYVSTTLDREAQAVRGQVSFYRGSVPVEVPPEAEAARQKKDSDAPWMATLPIKLPRLRGAGGHGRGAGLSLTPLNLGDAETGFLTQSNLLSVAGRLGPDWPTVALHLGTPYRTLQRIRHEFR
ncbi:p53-induced death domain-containing protein 1 isoform 3-T3 [Thomomys bottae]